MGRALTRVQAYWRRHPVPGRPAAVPLARWTAFRAHLAGQSCTALAAAAGCRPAAMQQRVVRVSRQAQAAAEAAEPPRIMDIVGITVWQTRQLMAAGGDARPLEIVLGEHEYECLRIVSGEEAPTEAYGVPVRPLAVQRWLTVGPQA